MSNNYHEILGVSPGATQKEIAKAYKELALKWHPDKNRGNEETAKKKFIEVSEAYNALKNPTSTSKPRKNYDFSGKSESEKFEMAFEILRELKNNLDQAWEQNQEDLKNVNEEIELKKKEDIQRMEEHLSLNGVSASDLDSSLWAPYGDWREVIEKDFGLKSELFQSEMRIAIAKVKYEKTGQGDSHNDYKHQGSHGNSKDWKGSPKNGDFSDRKDNGSWKSVSNPSEYIKELEEKIGIYRERILKTSDEREKQKYQEMINNFEKEIEILKNQPETNTQNPPSSSNDNNLNNRNSNNNNSNNNREDKEKDQKISQLEAEIEQLKNQNSATQTPEQQAENQKKVEEKQKELEEAKKDKENNQDNPKTDNYEKWTHGKLNQEINKLKAEIERLKTDKNSSNSSAKIAELQSKLKKLEQAKDKINKSKNQKSDNNFPTSWVVGGGGILLVLGLTTLFLLRKRRRKK
jgi:curved DNA-binding protein CbpA